MNQLMVLAVLNTVAAFAMAVIVYGVTRIWRKPPVVHILWLIVLLKLVTPPIIRADWLAIRIPAPTPASHEVVGHTPRIEMRTMGHAGATANKLTDHAGASARTEFDPEPDHILTSASLLWDQAWTVVFWLWVGGAVTCALVAVVSVVRFERLLRAAPRAPDSLQEAVLEVAAKLGVQHPPDVRLAAWVEVPMLWCAGHRPVILLPARLISQLDDRRISLILAHELAHLLRRDHWVRAMELIISAIYWWNPLVRLIRQQIHAAEELCCDAWVVWAYPDCRKKYAEAMLNAAESLDNSQIGAHLLPACPLLRSLSLKERIEMLLENRFSPRASTRSMFALFLVAVVALPLSVNFVMTDAAAATTDEVPVKPTDTSFVAKLFKYRIAFETGLKQSKDGGRIEISEVWGTRPKIEVGGQYLVRGKYALPRGVRGKLYFYATAGGPWGKTASLDLQSTVLDKQEGEFALMHGMAGPGYFHLILTDVEKYSEQFANVYFGTGDNVYRKN